MMLEPIKIQDWYKSKEYKFQVGDIEAKNWIEFIVAGFYDGEKYQEFHSLEAFAHFIYESKKPLNIFFHFGGGYDFNFMIKIFLEQNIEIKQIIPRGSGMLSMKIKGLFKTHTLRDSSALLPFSLKKITESFNVETKKGEWDHSKTEGYTKELGEYLKSDCLGLYQSLKAFFNSDLVRKSGAATTIASQAQRILRTYLKKPIASLNPTVNEFCREACHGGRTEIFRPLAEDVIEYDINSLYPYVMKENHYPSGIPIFTRRFRERNLGIYKCEIETPKDLFLPMLPVKIDKKLMFPLGKFTTTITSEEIKLAKKHGYKIKIIEGYFFTKKEKYFKEFITDLYKIRQSSGKNTVQNVLAKLIMNSSYGKFLIRTDKENLIFNAELGATPFREIELDDKTVIEIYKKPVELNSFVNAAIGAFILAYARLHMFKLMEPLGDKIYYMDTDSCWTTENLKSSDKLGEFKKEALFKQACFIQPKTYIAEGDKKKLAMKGFDKKKIQHFTYQDFRASLQGELMLEVKHDQTIAKLRSAMQKNKILMLKKSYTKRILSVYNKRKLNLKLNTSKPLVITAD